jgi:hypothetical protein
MLNFHCPKDYERKPEIDERSYLSSATASLPSVQADPKKMDERYVSSVKEIPFLINKNKREKLPCRRSGHHAWASVPLGPWRCLRQTHASCTADPVAEPVPLVEA